MFTFRWGETALEFIHQTLPAFPDTLQETGERFVQDIFSGYVLPAVKDKAPVFSGDLRKDLDFTLISSEEGHAYWWLGESGKLAIGAEDTHKHPAPFSYPLAQHDGAEGHLVQLYATNSYSRKKLRRWVREKMFASLPESKDDAEMMRASGHYVPLSVWVTPANPHDATSGYFLYKRFGALPVYIASGAKSVIRSIAGSLGRFWR